MCLLLKRFYARGEEDFVPEGESQGGVYQTYFWGMFIKLKVANEKINAIFDKKVNVSEALEVLAGYVKWI